MKKDDRLRVKTIMKNVILKSTLREMFEEDVDPEHVLFDQLSTFEYIDEAKSTR